MDFWVIRISYFFRLDEFLKPFHRIPFLPVRRLIIDLMFFGLQLDIHLVNLLLKLLPLLQHPLDIPLPNPPRQRIPRPPPRNPQPRILQSRILRLIDKLLPFFSHSFERTLPSTLIGLIEDDPWEATWAWLYNLFLELLPVEEALVGFAGG